MNPFIFKMGNYNDYIEITNFLSKMSKGNQKYIKIHIVIKYADILLS